MGDIMKGYKNIIWGLLFIIVGVIVFTNSFGITNITIFFDGWWTLFIIIPCAIGLFGENKMGNFIGLIVGVLLYLLCQDFISFDIILKLILPFILILIGLSMIFKNNEVTKKIKEIKKEKGSEYYATFSSQKLDFSGEKINNIELSAVFGSITCDLRESKLDNETVVYASSIFGGIDIIVPKDVNVKVTSTSIFGGVENKVKNNTTNKKTIYINATCLFGGVDIK